jgi:transcriptional repressor NrdR
MKIILRGEIMKCPFCDYYETKVVDSRPTDEGQAIRRRRECIKCSKRFTTYEKVEEIPLIIIKKDKSRESYDRNKILNGILKACEKRPVPLSVIEETVDEIEKTLYNSMEKEVTSQHIGEMIMNKLKNIDEVAYVRFASVYRQFKDINTFMEELKKLLNEE